MGRTVAIIQARMGSTRLPGKIMKLLCGKSVLEHVIQRVSAAGDIDEIVVATTTAPGDDPLVVLCDTLKIPVFRGSEDDVLLRYREAAQWAEADTVIRITSDCPLIDPEVISGMLACFKTGEYDFVTNSGPAPELRTFPRGLDTEIFSFEWLDRAETLAEKAYEREHVTPYLYAHCGRIRHFLCSRDYSEHRWTLDTPEDYELIRRIYDEMCRSNRIFTMKDVLELLEVHPEWMAINAHIAQKTY